MGRTQISRVLKRVGRMNLSNSISAAIPSAHGPVLQELVLLDRPTRSAVPARRLKLLVGRSRVCEVVEELWLVVSEFVAGSRFISINKDHLAYPGVEALAGLCGKFIMKLQHELGIWNPRPSLTYVFGSLAKNSSNLHSAVDLLVIGPDWLQAEDADWSRKPYDLEVNIAKWTSNQAQIVEHSQNQWRALTKEKYQLVSEVESGGIRLYPHLNIAH